MTTELTNFHGNWGWEQTELVQVAVPMSAPKNWVQGQVSPQCLLAHTNTRTGTDYARQEPSTLDIREIQVWEQAWQRNWGNFATKLYLPLMSTIAGAWDRSGQARLYHSCVWAGLGPGAGETGQGQSNYQLMQDPGLRAGLAGKKDDSPARLWFLLVSVRA